MFVVHKEKVCFSVVYRMRERTTIYIHVFIKFILELPNVDRISRETTITRRKKEGNNGIMIQVLLKIRDEFILELSCAVPRLKFFFFLIT